MGSTIIPFTNQYLYIYILFYTFKENSNGIYCILQHNPLSIGNLVRVEKKESPFQM